MFNRKPPTPPAWCKSEFVRDDESLKKEIEYQRNTLLASGTISRVDLKRNPDVNEIIRGIAHHNLLGIAAGKKCAEIEGEISALEDEQEQLRTYKRGSTPALLGTKKFRIKENLGGAFSAAVTAIAANGFFGSFIPIPPFPAKGLIVWVGFTIVLTYLYGVVLYYMEGMVTHSFVQEISGRKNGIADARRTRLMACLVGFLLIVFDLGLTYLLYSHTVGLDFDDSLAWTGVLGPCIISCIGTIVPVGLVYLTAIRQGEHHEAELKRIRANDYAIHEDAKAHERLERVELELKVLARRQKEMARYTDTVLQAYDNLNLALIRTIGGERERETGHVSYSPDDYRQDDQNPLGAIRTSKTELSTGKTRRSEDKQHDPTRDHRDFFANPKNQPSTGVSPSKPEQKPDEEDDFSDVDFDFGDDDQPQDEWYGNRYWSP